MSRVIWAIHDPKADFLMWQLLSCILIWFLAGSFCYSAELAELRKIPASSPTAHNRPPPRDMGHLDICFELLLQEQPACESTKLPDTTSSMFNSASTSQTVIAVL